MEEIKVIMLDNMNKADERAGKLEDLDDRAEKLLEHVSLFYHIDSLYYYLIYILTFLPLKRLDKKHAQIIMHSMVLTSMILFYGLLRNLIIINRFLEFQVVSRESKGMSNWSL